MKKEQLENFLGRQTSFYYDGPDLPDGRIGPTKVSGTIISVGINTFIIQFNDRAQHELTNEHLHVSK